MSMQSRQMVSSPVGMTKTGARKAPDELEPVPGRWPRTTRQEQLGMTLSARQPKAQPRESRGHDAAGLQGNRAPLAITQVCRCPAVCKHAQLLQAATTDDERAQ